MKYLTLLIVALLLPSCSLWSAVVDPIVTAAGDPAVQTKALEVVDDIASGKLVSALLGVATVVGLIYGKKGVAAVGKKLRESEPGKIL